MSAVDATREGRRANRGARDGGRRKLEDVVLTIEPAARGAGGHVDRALRRELLAQRRIARIGLILRNQVVALSTDVRYGQDRRFRNFALEREVEVLAIRQHVMNVVARKESER